MANAAPTSDVYFSWSRNIKFSRHELPFNPVNLVATSDRFGLVFIASNNELLWTTVSAIEKEHSIEKQLPDSESFPLKGVSLPAAEIHGVFLSADELVLAVCSMQNALPLCNLFDVRAFFDENTQPIGPFHAFPLSSTNGVSVVDLSFNPVIVEMFAVITSDGHVTNYEIGYEDPRLKIIGSVQANAMCCSWSPKGKQLVVGKKDGTLSQLKPNLVEAKAIPAPELQSPKASSIFWLASTVFAVAYTQQARVSFIVVVLQKNQPPRFIDFDEVCMKTSDAENYRMWLCPVPQWNLLLVCCGNSNETALLRHNDDKTEWTLLDIEGDRATLPCKGKDDTFPLGACIAFCSTKIVEKNGFPSRPPSPFLLMVNTSGSLSPFYIINNRATTSITSPPEALTVKGMRPSMQSLATRNPLAALGASTIPTETAPSTSARSSIFAASPAPLSFGAGLSAKPPPLVTSVSSAPADTPQISKITVSDSHGGISGVSYITSTPLPAAQDPASGRINETNLNKEGNVSRSLSENILKKEATLSQKTLSKAFFSELSSLTAEIAQFKIDCSQSAQIQVGTQQEMAAIRRDTSSLEKNMQDVQTSLKFTQTRIQRAEGVSLDALACGSQLKSLTKKEAKNCTLTKIDPVTEHSLKQARGMTQYLESQLRTANGRLDENYENYINKAKQRKISTTDMLYKTVLSCDLKIRLMARELTDIKTKIDGVKRIRSIRGRKDEALSSLADSLLNTSIKGFEENTSIGKTPSRERRRTSSLSPQKMKSLADYLRHNPPKEITPTRISSSGESNIVSKLSAILEQSRIEATMEEVAAKATTASAHRPTLVEATPLKPISTSSPHITSTPFVTSDVNPPPKYEQISPPAHSRIDVIASMAGMTPCNPTSFAPSGTIQKSIFPFGDTVTAPAGNAARVSSQPPRAKAMPLSTPLKQTSYPSKDAEDGKPQFDFGYTKSSAHSNKEHSTNSSTITSVEMAGKATKQTARLDTDMSTASQSCTLPSYESLNFGDLADKENVLPQQKERVSIFSSQAEKAGKSHGDTAAGARPKQSPCPPEAEKPARHAHRVEEEHKLTTPRLTKEPTTEPGSSEIVAELGSLNRSQAIGSQSGAPKGAPDEFAAWLSTMKPSSGERVPEEQPILQTTPKKDESPATEVKPGITSDVLAVPPNDPTPGTVSSTASAGATTATEGSAPFSFGASAIAASTTPFSSASPAGVTFAATAPSPTSTTDSTALFGKQKSQPIFGNPTTTGSLFGTTTSTGSSLFGQKSSFAPPVNSSSIFGGSISQTTPPVATVAAMTSPTSTIFGAPTTMALTFGSPSASVVSNVPATQTSATSIFASAPAGFGSSPPFGGVVSSTTGQQAFGSIPTSTAVPAFGVPATAAPAPSFGSPPLNVPAFGAVPSTAPAFGSSVSPSVPGGFVQSPQSGGGLFGKTEQGGLFGKTGGGFGHSSGSLFGQKSAFGSGSGNTSLFGGNVSGSLFSGGPSFMSGLGQQVTASPNKNVFGGGTTFGQNNPSNLFGSGGGANAFGAPGGGNNAFGGSGITSSPFSQATQQPVTGSFSAFSQSPQKPSAFGAAPTFGGSPGGFGSSPAFGASPSFGGAPAFGSSPVTTSTFGAAASAPSFGALAQQAPTFGGPAQSPSFGSAAATNMPSFGAAPTQAPGSPQSPAFTQYRG